MNKDKIDKYVDELNKRFEELENTLQFLSYAYLLKNYKQPQFWFQKQQEDLSKFKKKVNEIAQEKLTELNEIYKNTLYLAYTQATNEEVVVDDQSKDIIVNTTNKFDELVETTLNQNKLMVANLTANVVNNHITSINEIGSKVLNLPNTEELYQQIVKSIDVHGVRDNLKVVYKNGRIVDWKVYMEMNARTTMANEITNFQVESGTKNKVVFWLCSQHSDCADDHINYQGKLYYDDNYRSFGFDLVLLNKITMFIHNKKLMSIQSVKDGKPYLTTRPNCRHYFQPVSIEKAMGTSTTQLLNDLKMNKGKGDADKYDNLVQQRYNERQIRKWKKELQKAEMGHAVNPNDERTSKRLKYAKDKIAFWQKNQRQLLKGKDYLERDYDRETNEILVNDLGYRFNKALTKK